MCVINEHSGVGICIGTVAMVLHDVICCKYKPSLGIRGHLVLTLLILKTESSATERAKVISLIPKGIN